MKSPPPGKKRVDASTAFKNRIKYYYSLYTLHNNINIRKRRCLPLCCDSEDEFTSEDEIEEAESFIGLPPYWTNKALCKRIPLRHLNNMKYMVPGAPPGSEKLLRFRWIDFVCFKIALVFFPSFGSSLI